MHKTTTNHQQFDCSDQDQRKSNPHDEHLNHLELEPEEKNKINLFTDVSKYALYLLFTITKTLIC